MMDGRSRPASVDGGHQSDGSLQVPHRRGKDLASATQRGRILIADDEPAIVDVLALLLDDAGFDVIRAYDGQQALELARTHHPDVIVTDDYMPRLTGEELVRRIQADRGLAPTPIILMSAVPSLVRTGFGPLLAKPFDLDELLDLIESAIDSGRRM